jgi:hypothetical protein
MYLTRKMKFYSRIVISLGIQEPLALCQVNKVPIFINSCVRLFKPRKLFELAWIFTCYPTGFIKR